MMLKVGVEYLDWDKARVVAKLGDVVVEKTAALTGCALAVCKGPEQQQAALAWEIAKKAREADRDIAYKIHGPNFREHCLFTSNFWGPMTAEEWACVDL
jgi:hypothetical protein